MAIKKSQLYSSLWQGCDELRGGMDASQYKDYVLVLLFVKYVSDKYAGKADALIEVPADGSFKAMVALKGDKEIGDRINKIISALADANDLKGIIDVADFNDENKLGKGKEMQDRLANLITIFENPSLNFSKNRAEGDDLLGDAYEYLMRHFATESGKSKGQFYTPAEVSRVIAKVIDINQATSPQQTLYDPTCGSGSLLLKAADEAPIDISIYGQDMDNTTRALAKMNTILHGKVSAQIEQGNTLANPLFKQADGSLKTFDFVVANPPFSSKSWSNGINTAKDNYERFGDGVPPAKNGDYAFMLHIIRSLKSTGKGAVILPHGVLFRGNAEGEIRKNIIKKAYIKGIIALPANLFYGTGIPAAIIVLDKANAASSKGIFMIDASKGFSKDGNKNRLRHQDIHKIVDVFTKQIEIAKYSRMVSFTEIEKNDYNLNIPRYIDSSEEEDIQDIEAHLLGGIPNHDLEKLKNYWQVYPGLNQELFAATNRAGYSQIKLEPSQIKATIYNHPEFIAYSQQVNEVFNRWQVNNMPMLQTISIGMKPKALIEALSEDLLQCFSNLELIDKYDVYQHLMSYWSDTMQDDVYLIAAEGWQVGRLLNLIMDKSEKAELELGKSKFKGELIPTQLVIDRYFAEQKIAIEQLEASKETLSQQIEELEEEQSGEDGVLEDLKSDKGKISKGSVQKRIKDIHKDSDAADELKVLAQYLSLLDQEAEAENLIKVARTELAKKVIDKYKNLTEEEIKQLLIEDKWMLTLSNAIKTEMNRISQTLAQRVKELAERYEAPLPRLTTEVEELSEKVEVHLKKMGFVWK